MARDSSTDGIRIGGAPSSRATEVHTVTDSPGAGAAAAGREAAVILIAHPENRRLGARFRLVPGEALVIGRDVGADVSLPEAPSLSRRHARVRLAAGRVTLEDLGSRNGTHLNDVRIDGAVELASGDRFQLGNVHFKFLQERDVEHAYYEAIYEMVVRDGLTGIYNRRKFFEEGARELARAQRHGRALALLLLDVDHFKRVNDELGHLAGDSILKQLVARLQGLARAEELFARIGGEEFAVLCPETDLEHALVLAERLRRLAAEAPFDVAGAPVSITCSIGVAALTPGMARLEDLLRAADQALYAAKRDGRDRVRAASPEPPS